MKTLFQVGPNVPAEKRFLISSPATSRPCSKPSFSAGISLRLAAVLGLLLAFAGDGLAVYFSGDDLMNLYQYVQKGWGVARGIALFWSSEFYRPLGGVVYMGLYSVFGFDPVPFKVFAFVLLLLNLALAWRVAASILKDSRAALFAVLLVAYNATANDLYYNFGTIYEILCFTFTLSALWIWLRIRDAGRYPGPLGFGLILILHILALGSKEMAVVLPVLVFFRELFWGKLLSRARPWIQWRAVPGIAALALVTAVYIAGKGSGAGALANQPLYHPNFSLHVYLADMSSYLNQFFYARFFKSGLTAWFLCGGLALAAVLRLRAMAFGWLWFIFGLLPVSFIAPRSGFVLYIPSIGFAIAGADLLRKSVEMAARHRWTSWLRRLHPAGAAAFVLALAVLVPSHAAHKRIFDPNMKKYPALYREFARDLDRSGPFPKGASVLYFSDPFSENFFDPLFLTSLHSGDPALGVGRAKVNQALLSPSAAALFHSVFDYRNGHLQKLRKDEIAAQSSRLRSELGSADPDSGVYVSTEAWWWAQKDFGMTARCPAAHPDCRLAITFVTPVGPFEYGEKRTLAVEIGGKPWRDIPLQAQFAPFTVEVPLPAGPNAAEVRFHLDKALPRERLASDGRALAIVISNVRLRF